MADAITVEGVNIAIENAFMVDTPPVPKWLCQVPFDPVLLNLNIKADEMKYIVQVLNKVSVDWFDIGFSLGVPLERLKKVEKDYGGYSRQLIEMIACWINTSENHTWRALIDVLFELGYMAAVGAVIKSATLVITGYKSVTDESVPTRNWSEISRRKDKKEEELSKYRLKVERREKAILEQICHILCIPNASDTDCLLDDIDNVIRKNENLTYSQLSDVVLKVIKLSELYSKYSTTLRKWTEDISQDIKITTAIQSQLRQRKYELAEHLFKLSEDVKDVKTKLNEREWGKEDDQALLQLLAEYEGNIKAVKYKMELCIKELHYANCDYQSLSDTLSDCVNKLQMATTKNEKIKAIAYSCENRYKIIKIFLLLPVIFGVSWYLCLLVPEGRTITKIFAFFFSFAAALATIVLLPIPFPLGYSILFCAIFLRSFNSALLYENFMEFTSILLGLIFVMINGSFILTDVRFYLLLIPSFITSFAIDYYHDLFTSSFLDWADIISALTVIVLYGISNTSAGKWSKYYAPVMVVVVTLLTDNMTRYYSVSDSLKYAYIFCKDVLLTAAIFVDLSHGIQYTSQRRTASL